MALAGGLNEMIGILSAVDGLTMQRYVGLRRSTEAISSRSLTSTVKCLCIQDKTLYGPL